MFRQMREVKAKENKKELAAKKASKLTITKKAKVEAKLAPRRRTYNVVYTGKLKDLLERETTQSLIVKLENKMELSPKYKRDYPKLDRKVVPI